MGCKLARIKEQEILLMFQLKHGYNPECIGLSVTPEVPDGSIVEAIMYDWASQCFWVRLYHSSFPEIAEGERIPFINEMLKLKVYVHKDYTEAMNE